MRTTLNIEDRLIEKASKLTGVKRKDFSGQTWLGGPDRLGKQQEAGEAWSD